MDDFYAVLLEYWRFKGQAGMEPEQPDSAESPSDFIEIPDDLDEDQEEDLSEVMEVIKQEPVELEESRKGVKPVEFQQEPVEAEKNKKVEKPVDLEENTKVAKAEPEETPEQAVLDDPYFVGESHEETEVVSSSSGKYAALSDDELNMRIATLKFLCLHSFLSVEAFILPLNSPMLPWGSISVWVNPTSHAQVEPPEAFGG